MITIEDIQAKDPLVTLQMSLGENITSIKGTGNTLERLFREYLEKRTALKNDHGVVIDVNFPAHVAAAYTVWERETGMASESSSFDPLTADSR